MLVSQWNPLRMHSRQKLEGQDGHLPQLRVPLFVVMNQKMFATPGLIHVPTGIVPACTHCLVALLPVGFP